MSEPRSAVIYYSGFAFRGGGAFMHAKVLRRQLERTGWQVELVTLERLPLPIRFVPHVLGKVLNFVNPPMGFIYKDRLTRLLYRRFLNRRANLIVFEDIYVSWNSKDAPAVTMLHAMWSDNLQSIAVARSAVCGLVAKECHIVDSIEHPIITVSDEYKESLLSSHSGSCRLLQARVVPLGLDVADFVRGPASSESRKRLVFCGSLEKRKNLMLLLAVFQVLKQRDGEYRLTVIGDGPDRESLERFSIAGSLGVNFLGRLDRASVISEIQRHGVYVHPSKKESFSFSLLEARLLGLVTIAYQGLQVPAEFIDVPVKSFELNDWLTSIFSAQTANPLEIDRNRYSAEKMMTRTLDAAFGESRPCD